MSAPLYVRQLDDRDRQLLLLCPCGAKFTVYHACWRREGVLSCPSCGLVLKHPRVRFAGLVESAPYPTKTERRALHRFRERIKAKASQRGKR